MGYRQCGAGTTLSKFKKINEDASKIISSDPTLTPELQKIGDFWASAMDTAKAEKMEFTRLMHN